MTLAGKVIEATPGMRGFDCDQHISAYAAAQFRMKGYRFAIRYVPRIKASAGDLSMSEASGILAAGLGLMVVQHVLNPGWSPTGTLGKQYGAFAAQSALDIGYKFGAMLWCDLEGVGEDKPKDGIDPRDVIAFLNNWHDQVGNAGYTPGLYVGYDTDLTPDQLYSRLRFSHYWGSYNLDADKRPDVRGLQMKQQLEQTLDGIKYDPDVIQRDALGGLPLMHVDLEWTP
jgi:hypothetical protein